MAHLALAGYGSISLLCGINWTGNPLNPWELSPQQQEQEYFYPKDSTGCREGS